MISMVNRKRSLIILIFFFIPTIVLAQQGKWQRFGWNPPTVTQKDTNGGTWTYFGSGALDDSGLIMRPVSPIHPYQWQNPYYQSDNGFGMQLHLNLDFSLHYKNGLLQGLPLYYGPWINPRGNYRGYWWPLLNDSTSRDRN